MRLVAFWHGRFLWRAISQQSPQERRGNEAKEILERAKQDAENYRRETELALKEASIKQKEEIEKEKID